MPRRNLPQKSSSQPTSSPTAAGPEVAIGAVRSASFRRAGASPLTCCSCGYSPLPAMPSWARASRMRMPAVRTPGFRRWASSTSCSRTGSSKLRHHSSSLHAEAARPPAASLRRLQRVGGPAVEPGHLRALEVGPDHARGEKHAERAGRARASAQPLRRDGRHRFSRPRELRLPALLAAHRDSSRPSP